MSNKSDDTCCHNHILNAECDPVLEVLKIGPSCSDAESTTQKRAEWLSKIRRESVDKPVIFIGMGTCGLGAGAGKTRAKIDEYLKSNQIQADIVEVGCIGLCVDEPIVEIQLPGRNRIAYRKITEDKVETLLDSLLKQQVALAKNQICQHRSEKLTPWENVTFFDEHPFFAPQTRWVLANCGIIDPDNIDEYIAHGGYRALIKTLRNFTPAEVCDLMEQSGLRGRGGAGFLTGKKWKFALAEKSEQKYFICNADEGDPGAFMDRAVIEGDPYRLLEGLAIAAYAIGATKAYIYIRAEYPLAVRRLRESIKEAKEYGLLGQNILDSGFNLEITIKMGAGAFVCGEETALMASIEGRRGMPRPRPPFPAVSGLFGKPTVINNVETLANIAEILANGKDWFSSLGTAKSKGTKVFALSGKINRTGLVEVAMGTKLRDIIFSIGGGIPDGKKFKAVQIGGPSGGCIPTQHLDIEIDYETLQTVGAVMGSGGLVVMDETTCMVDVAKFFMDFIQKESCGKCIPCREGTRRMLEILQRITRSRRNEVGNEALERFKGIMYLNRLARVIQDTSLCGLGKTSPNPVLSTLRWFRDEYEAHIFERKCPAGVCTELLTYEIDPEKCVGCTACAKNCPAKAIIGNPKTPHFIVADKCIGCGSCVEVCRFKAVTVK
ncbi:MAG: NADH-quinone oxidoreductase subunit NuoF [Candidatus Marinimicrobia bacterium]|nr:NADH-quinone oxidoreductase subunit NuoF [Candidatus Neomarinimicrobiota bacterium]